jgi:hypothetical protein
MDKFEWKKEMVPWVCRFPWLWFCTLTLRPGLSEAQARWRLHRWLSNLREALGTANFGYFAVREFGRTGNDLHFHVLVMGLNDWGVEARLEWMGRWEKIGGDPRIDPFTPGPRGPEYTLKNVMPDDLNAIDFDMSSETQMQTSMDDK